MFVNTWFLSDVTEKRARPAADVKKFDRINKQIDTVEKIMRSMLDMMEDDKKKNSSDAQK